MKIVEIVYENDKPIGHMIDGQFIPLAPEPTESELAYAMRVLVPLLSRGTQGEYLPDCRDLILAALREGANVESAVKELIARRHEKEDAFTLGKGRHKELSLDDLRAWYRQFVKDNQANRERWALRFEAGLSKYLCPKCGFSGHGFNRAYGTAKWLHCPICIHTDPVEVFTRVWTKDEWQQRQEEQEKQQKADYAVRQEKEQIERDRQELIESRAAELWERLPDEADSYEGVLTTASRIAASRLEFTVDEILALWAPVHKVIEGMDISEEQDDLPELLIARAVLLTPEPDLRRILENAKVPS
jgi:hypothetical protein